MNITEGDTPNDTIVRVTGKIISAYVTNNRIDRLRIGELIDAVRGSLHELASGVTIGANHGESLRRAVPIKRSVTADFLVCLEDGARLKMLKRHLRTHYGLSPQEYREKWGLPHDYPMVAPNYAARRSELARQIGLGGQESQNRRKRR